MEIPNWVKYLMVIDNEAHADEACEFAIEMLAQRAIVRVVAEVK